jgi:apolipoprotein D and lipocalin family protein
VLLLLGVGLLGLMLLGCQSGPQRGDPPMTLATDVDLPRFMGTWYVHGYTPTAIDRNAFNPTETYELREDGTILTTYQFNAGAADGPVKTYHPKGRVFDPSDNAEWRMTFFGVITSPYLVLYVSDDYTETVIGHPNRKLAWIMTRGDNIPETDYQRLRDELKERGFDLAALRRARHD